MRSCTLLAAAGTAWILAACSPDAEVAPRHAESRIVDLTHAYDEDTVYWPTDTRGFRLEKLAAGPTEAGWYYSANAFCTAEHGGTHIDAPIHFYEGGQAVDALPLEQLVGPGVVIDVTSEAASDPDYRLDRAAIERHEASHGPIPQGAIVLLRTGWSDRWPDALAYLGDDTPGDAGNLSFPGYGEAAAQFLIDERGTRLLGIDTASIDYGRSGDFPVHRLAASQGVAGLENLANLGKLPAVGFTVIALPMKIAGGSGGPVRVVAMLLTD